ncbi:hypothetical protein SFUMM280S_11334 [Streptomyces fumanus]
MTPRHQRRLGRRKLLVALGGAAVAAPVAAAVAPYALAGTDSGRAGRGPRAPCR